MHFRKIGVKSGIHFGKIGIRNGYVFETSMARPHPKSGQVTPGPWSSICPVSKKEVYTFGGGRRIKSMWPILKTKILIHQSMAILEAKILCGK